MATPATTRLLRIAFPNMDSAVRFWRGETLNGGHLLSDSGPWAIMAARSTGESSLLCGPPQVPFTVPGVVVRGYLATDEARLNTFSMLYTMPPHSALRFRATMKDFKKQKLGERHLMIESRQLSKETLRRVQFTTPKHGGSHS